MTTLTNIAVPGFHASAHLADQGRVLVAETTGWLADNSLRILIAFGGRGR